MKAADRHFHCFVCGMDYRVQGFEGPLWRLQEVVMRCINTRGGNAGYGEGLAPSGVTCGGILSWVSRAYPHSEGSVIATGYRNLTLTTIAAKSIVDARDGALAEAARLGAQVDQLRAALDDAHRAIAHLDPDGLSGEVARLRALHETPCPGFVHPWEDGQDGAQPCGGYHGHPGDCAPYWASQSGWRVPA
jgi:hypothetical protein